MIRTIGMFGSEQSIKELRPAFQESDIDLMEHDFITVQEVLEELNHELGVAVVLVIERMSFGVEQGKYGLITQIREADPTVRIAFCADAAQKDHEFENWCYKYRVYDIFYPDKKGDFNISEIATYIKKGRLSAESSEDSTNIDISEEELTTKGGKGNKIGKGKKNTFEKLSKRLEIKNPFRREKVNESISAIEEPQVIIKEVEKTVEVIRVVEKPIEIIKEVVKNVYVDRTVEVIKRQNSASYLIAVFNLSRGAGATQTTVNMAEALAGLGHSVAVVAMDQKNDLKYQNGKAEYIVPEDDQADTLIHFLAGNGKHDYIILDFGTLFELSPIGKLLNHNLADSKAKIGEFMRCQLHVGMGFSSEWHVNKIKYFVETDVFSERIKTGGYVFFFDQEVKKLIKKYGDLQVYERTALSPTDYVIQTVLSIDSVKTKKRRIFGN